MAVCASTSWNLRGCNYCQVETQKKYTKRKKEREFYPSLKKHQEDWQKIWTSWILGTMRSRGERLRSHPLGSKSICSYCFFKHVRQCRAFSDGAFRYWGYPQLCWRWWVCWDKSPTQATPKLRLKKTFSYPNKALASQGHVLGEVWRLRLLVQCMAVWTSHLALRWRAASHRGTRCFPQLWFSHSSFSKCLCSNLGGLHLSSRLEFIEKHHLFLMEPLATPYDGPPAKTHRRLLIAEGIFSIRRLSSQFF